MNVINILIDKGNSVIIIEHNIDVIKLADYIIDIGPEGGINGGSIICEGTPEEIVKQKKGYTYSFLKEEL
jgi:excinuclease ABC subunit A